MAACDLRQLSQTQREAAYEQQRTGVQRAVRPFSGSPTIENLIDYVNRELCPAVKSSRDKLNDIFKQVADNAPSANPLSYYFSESAVNADPTVGRIRLNNTVQNTATVLRVSQSNSRLADMTPWLDVMSGGPTAPLGVITLSDAINPGRFLRFDLNSMVDQGAYWDLGITIIESSSATPFTENEAVMVSFIAGVSAAGSTIPVGALSPVAADTFLGNIGTTAAPPAAVPFANVDSLSIVYDAASHELRRAALTGFAASAANSNATTSAEPLVTFAASANMSAERVATSSTSVAVSIGVASQIEFQRAALTGDVTAPLNSNTLTLAAGAVTSASLRDSGPLSVIGRSANSTGVTADISSVASDNVLRESGAVLGFGTVATGGIANNAVTNAKLADMATPRLKGRTTAATGDPEDLTLGNSTSITWNTSTGGALAVERAALTGDITASANSNTTAIAAGVIVNADVNASAGINLSKLATGDAVTWSGGHSFSAFAAFSGNFRFNGIGANASTGQVDDLDVSGVTVMRFTGPPALLTGLTAAAGGQMVLLVNASASADTTVSDQNASSLVGNRFALPNGVTSILLRRNGAVLAWFDGTTNRWRIVRMGSEVTI